MPDPDPRDHLEPQPRNHSDLPGEADEAGTDAVPGQNEPDHDPTGLELARRIAAAVGRGNAPRTGKTGSGKPGSASPGSGNSGAARSGAARRPGANRNTDRDPKLLGPALEHLVSNQGWSTEISVHTLLGRWASLVGEVNAQHSSPESYADGVVVVRTDSTAWATSLRTIANQLVARLNDELGQGTVTRIRVLGPAGPSWKHGLRSVRGRGPRDTYG